MFAYGLAEHPSTKFTCCLRYWHTVKSRQGSYVCHYWGHHLIPMLSSGVHSFSGWMDVGIMFFFQKGRWRQQQLKITAVTAACGGCHKWSMHKLQHLRDRIAPKSWQNLWQCLLLPPTQLMDPATSFSGFFVISRPQCIKTFELALAKSEGLSESTAKDHVK